MDKKNNATSAKPSGTTPGPELMSQHKRMAAGYSLTPAPSKDKKVNP